MLRLFNAWVIFTLVLFYWGPIEWQGASSSDVGLFVLVCLLAFNIGAKVTFRQPVALTWTLPVPTRRVASYGIVLAYALLTFAHLYFITGRNALSVEAYSLNFGEVYTNYYTTQLDGDRGIVGIFVMGAKALLFPMVLLVMIRNFRTDRLLVLLVVGIMGISSMLRGTDKELVDIVIILGVVAACYGALNRRIILMGLGAVAGLLALFGVRRLSRYGGDPPTCLAESAVCFNYTSEMSRTFGRNAEFVYVFFTNYVTQGYQGLAYAFREPWVPNFGLGSLPPVKSATCQAADVACNLGDYQQSLQGAGWDTSVRWTSAYPILANDVSFWLVPVVMLLFGVAFAKARSIWAASRAPEAACTLVLLAVFWFYASANLQIAISLDWTVATLVFIHWFLLAPIRRVGAKSTTHEAVVHS